MAKDTKNAVFIDGIEHDIDAMTDEQKNLIHHVADLDRKLASARFNVDQLQVGRDAFFGMLKNSLVKPEEAKE